MDSHLDTAYPASNGTVPVTHSNNETGERARPARPPMAIRTTVAAGGEPDNHADPLAVRTAVSAGGRTAQHAEAFVARVVRTTVKAGGTGQNHSEALSARTAR